MLVDEFGRLEELKNDCENGNEGRREKSNVWGYLSVSAHEPQVIRKSPLHTIVLLMSGLRRPTLLHTNVKESPYLQILRASSLPLLRPVAKTSCLKGVVIEIEAHDFAYIWTNQSSWKRTHSDRTTHPNSSAEGGTFDTSSLALAHLGIPHRAYPSSVRPVLMDCHFVTSWKRKGVKDPQEKEHQMHERGEVVGVCAHRNTARSI